MEKSSKKGRKAGVRIRSKRPRREEPGVRIGRRNALLFLAGLGAILIGFLALAFGSTALPAVFLVVGYLVLVPWAILAGGGDQEEPATPGAEMRAKLGDSRSPSPRHQASKEQG